MKTVQPDIVVTSPEGEYWIIVEVKLNGDTSGAIEQLRHLMVAMNCSIGIAVAGERIVLLRDSLEQADGESISIVGEAKLPEALLPPADYQWSSHQGYEFASRVQRWLEQLKQPASTKNLSNDLSQLFGEPLISLLRLGDVRAAMPRWSPATS